MKHRIVLSSLLLLLPAVAADAQQTPNRTVQLHTRYGKVYAQRTHLLSCLFGRQQHYHVNPNAAVVREIAALREQVARLETELRIIASQLEQQNGMNAALMQQLDRQRNTLPRAPSDLGATPMPRAPSDVGATPMPRAPSDVGVTPMPLSPGSQGATPMPVSPGSQGSTPMVPSPSTVPAIPATPATNWQQPWPEVARTSKQQPYRWRPYRTAATLVLRKGAK